MGLGGQATSLDKSVFFFLVVVLGGVCVGGGNYNFGKGLGDKCAGDNANGVLM